MIRLGVLHETPYASMERFHEFPTPSANFDPMKGRELYGEFLEELVSAEELGFSVVALPEQHSKQDNIDPSPNILAAQLIGRTKRINILPYGAILPLHNPLRIAEEYAMLDVLSKGRLMAGFVRGGMTNYLAYGMDYEKESSRFEEAWDLIVKAWTTPDPFEWKGSHYQFDAVSVWPRPFQRPHPPLHTAGGGSIEFSAERDAVLGLGFTTTSEEVSKIYGRYRDAYSRSHGTSPAEGMFALARSVYVSDSDESAREECEMHLMHQYRVLYRPSMLANRKIAQEKNMHLYWADRLFLTEENYEQIEGRGNHIAGSPETVANQILAQQKELGFGTFLGLFRFGDMPHEKAMKSMKLFSEEVMPRLRGAG